LTVSEYAVVIASWSSTDFKKKFCDYMTTEEILHAFSAASDEILWKFIAGLTKEDWYSMTRAEWNAFAQGLGSSGFKVILDGCTTEELIGIFSQLSEKNIIAYYEGLTEEEWRSTTPAEWRAIGWTWSSQDFKSLLDNCTADEIAWIFSNFSEKLYEKYYSGLTDEDYEKFTPAEWRAAFITWRPSDFKKYIFDEMTTEEINWMCEMFTDEDMDRFFEGLTASDWKYMTDAEWRAIIEGFDNKDDVIEFIHYFKYKKMLWVVTELASHAKKREIQEFYDSFKKDEYDLLSDDEWIAFKKGAEKVEDDEVVGKDSAIKRMYKFFFGEPDVDRRGRRHHGRE
jgi:hypothetical protein